MEDAEEGYWMDLLWIYRTLGGYVRPLGQAGVTPVKWRRRRFSPTAYTKTRGKLLGGSLYVIACVCKYQSTAAAGRWKMTMFHVLHTSRVMVVVQSPFTCIGLDISKVSCLGRLGCTFLYRANVHAKYAIAVCHIWAQAWKA